jgi:hypothetical protein
LKNKKEELVYEQGKRENIEAKKIKDASTNTATLAAGAAFEGAKNIGWDVMEQLTSAILKAAKDELIDVFSGGQSALLKRVERFLKKIWQVIQRIIDAPQNIFKGIFEFIVNALSKAINQIYMMAKNIFDLANSAWELFQGAQTMSKEELIQKISETVIVSGTLVFWDAFDPVIESQLLPLVGPIAPYLASAISAIGFGVSSHYLQQFLPKVIEFFINVKTSYFETLQAQRAACEQLMALAERELRLIDALGEYAKSSKALEIEMQGQIKKLSNHQAIERFDVHALLGKK